MRQAATIVAGLCLSIVTARAAETNKPMAVQLCNALTHAVTLQAHGENSVFVRSYEPAADEARLPAGLSSSAFTYDNAVAAIALVACDDVASASLIGNALSAAIERDRTFNDGRIRNAYRSGPVERGAALLPGWWDAANKMWGEDAAQNGSSTGNAAWAVLALLTLHDATHNATYLANAERLFDWIIQTTSSDKGFTGGAHGYDPQQVRLTWMSTEHNIDVYAAAHWLFGLSGNDKYAKAMSQSRGLVESAFRSDHFLLGTTSDGSFAKPEDFALDVQLWSWMAIEDAPPAWRSSLQFAEKQLGVPGGFDFNGDRDGVWVEGTAQAALGYRIAGRLQRYAELIAGLEQDRAPSGFLNATRQGRITTGLSIDPAAGTTADFYYFKRPHLGATAWATLAVLGWNPFTGRKLN